MSYVTDIAIIAPSGSEDALRYIRAWFDRTDYGTVENVSRQGGGNKAHQWDMWSGAFNFFDIPAFFAMMDSVPKEMWSCPDNVLVLIQDEHDDEPQLLRVGQWKKVGHD